MAMTLFEKGYHLFSVNLREGYHHIDIAKSHRNRRGSRNLQRVPFSLV